MSALEIVKMLWSNVYSNVINKSLNIKFTSKDHIWQNEEWMGHVHCYDWLMILGNLQNWKFE